MVQKGLLFFCEPNNKRQQIYQQFCVMLCRWSATLLARVFPYEFGEVFQPAILLKRRLQHMKFLVNFEKFLRTHIL